MEKPIKIGSIARDEKERHGRKQEIFNTLITLGHGKWNQERNYIIIINWVGGKARGSMDWNNLSVFYTRECISLMNVCMCWISLHINISFSIGVHNVFSKFRWYTHIVYTYTLTKK